MDCFNMEKTAENSAAFLTALNGQRPPVGPEKTLDQTPPGLSDVRRQLVGDKQQDGPATKTPETREGRASARPYAVTVGGSAGEQFSSVTRLRRNLRKFRPVFDSTHPDPNGVGNPRRGARPGRPEGRWYPFLIFHKIFH